jgi:hypothetical protein
MVARRGSPADALLNGQQSHDGIPGSRLSLMPIGDPLWSPWEGREMALGNRSANRHLDPSYGIFI